MISGVDVGLMNITRDCWSFPESGAHLDISMLGIGPHFARVTRVDRVLMPDMSDRTAIVYAKAIVGTN